MASFMLLCGEYLDGALSNPASTAASRSVTSFADLPKYSLAAASKPYVPDPR